MVDVLVLALRRAARDLVSERSISDLEQALSQIRLAFVKPPLPPELHRVDHYEEGGPMHMGGHGHGMTPRATRRHPRGSRGRRRVHIWRGLGAVPGSGGGGLRRSAAVVRRDVRVEHRQRPPVEAPHDVADTVSHVQLLSLVSVSYTRYSQLIFCIVPDARSEAAHGC
jgi:hypothetical protein